MELKGSQTEKNLWAAFAGESQAYTKYGYYASRAKKDGFEQISALFAETAGNEKEHAKIWFKLVAGVGTTAENLEAAADGEHEEWTSMYPEFAKVAKEEGFTKIARLFEAVAKIESEHEERYRICLQILRMRRCLRRTRRSSGSAATAAMSVNRRRRPRSVPSAIIRRRISNSSRRIIEKAHPAKEKWGCCTFVLCSSPIFYPAAVTVVC